MSFRVSNSRYLMPDSIFFKGENKGAKVLPNTERSSDPAIILNKDSFNPFGKRKALLTDTYGTGTGGIAGGAGRFFDLNDINSIIKELADKVQEDMAELGDAFSDPEQVISVDRMIIESLTGTRTLPDSSVVHFQPSESGSFIQANAMALDLSLDFQGVREWQGSVTVSKFHLDLHLEQVEISGGTWKGADIDGLKQLDARTVDTGRYLVGFRDMTTLTIYDKQTRLSTTVWGDPHVDLSDEEGNRNGEFSDLVKSDILTTFHLLDGTDVIVNAPDTGAIESVDVYKGDAHARGYGMGLIHAAESALSADNRNPGGLYMAGGRYMAGGFFSGVDMDTSALEPDRALSDVVNAGGDGNDWYDSSGNLVWGGNRKTETA